MKICTKCKVHKELSDFYKDPRPRDGLQSHCKECVRIAMRKNRVENGDKVRSDQRNSRLVRVYGITFEQRNKMLEDQGGVCAICLRESNRYAVDHNHTTGVVRGILCVNCNHRLLGAANDCPEILERAAIYLRKHQ